MSDMELQRGDDGNYVMRPADFRLHVDTGEEAEQQWPAVQADEETMPLLDMPEAWQMVIDEKELPAKKKIQGELIEVNARIMVKEISYHLLASTTLSTEGEDQKSHSVEAPENPSTEVEKAETELNGDDPDVPAKVEPGDGHPTAEEGSTDAKDAKVKSVYGASLLLKLQWEDKTAQKSVPHRTYAQLGSFIHQLTRDLLDVMEKNEKAGQAVLDTLAFELTLLLLARYMDGIETGVTILEESTYELLTLCAEHANPREMCMPLRTVVRKIDVVYLEPTSYLILQPLLRLWTTLVLRIPRKRHYYLTDLVKICDRLFKQGESYDLNYVEEDSEGVAKPGRMSLVWDILLDFFEDLTKVQLKHRDASDTIRLKVDELGRERPGASLTEVARSRSTENGNAEKSVADGNSNDTSAPSTEDASSKDKAGDIGEGVEGEKEASDAAAIDEETRDWVNERAATLARVLLMQGMIWNALQPPEGDERDSPHRKLKNVGSLARERAMRAEKNEHTLLRCHHLFKNLGWTNPVLVCQLAGGELHLDPCSQTEELFREHIKQDVRTKKERKGTLYSMNSVGLYLCGVLRPRTRRLLEGKNCGDVDEYAVELAGSGFDLLDPYYALDLALPYVMTLIPESTRTMAIGATLVARAFLDRIPDCGYETFDDVVRARCGTNSMGREVNLVGLAQHLCKAVAACDDPKHRRVAYETFQSVLRKVRDPRARYTIVECVFHDCKRVAVAAQLITEMKDAIRYSDVLAERGVGNWSNTQASSLKTRFVEVVLPTYFTPRKEMLMKVNAMVVVAGVVVWLGGSDRRLLERLGEGDKLRGSVEKRMEFVKRHCKLGRECIRALASVAEHDRKNMPKSQLAKSNAAEAQALFAASGRTLNSCMTALSLLTAAEPFLEGGKRWDEYTASRSRSENGGSEVPPDS